MGTTEIHKTPNYISNMQVDFSQAITIKEFMKLSALKQGEFIYIWGKDNPYIFVDVWGHEILNKNDYGFFCRFCNGQIVKNSDGTVTWIAIVNKDFWDAPEAIMLVLLPDNTWFAYNPPYEHEDFFRSYISNENASFKPFATHIEKLGKECVLASMRKFIEDYKDRGVQLPYGFSPYDEDDEDAEIKYQEGMLEEACSEFNTLIDVLSKMDTNALIRLNSVSRRIINMMSKYNNGA